VHKEFIKKTNPYKLSSLDHFYFIFLKRHDNVGFYSHLKIDQ